jgi:hypothetical protein
VFGRIAFQLDVPSKGRSANPRALEVMDFEDTLLDWPE